MPHPNLKIYTFAELKTATKNFRNDTILGEGGFGKVYKGWMEESFSSKFRGNGSVVAVKKLNSESMQGIEEWQVLYIVYKFIIRNVGKDVLFEKLVQQL